MPKTKELFAVPFKEEVKPEVRRRLVPTRTMNVGELRKALEDLPDDLPVSAGGWVVCTRVKTYKNESTRASNKEGFKKGITWFEMDRTP